MDSGFAVRGGVFGAYFGGFGGDGGGTVVDIITSCWASTGTWYGLKQGWGPGGRLAVGGEGGVVVPGCMVVDGGVLSTSGAGVRPIR